MLWQDDVESAGRALPGASVDQMLFVGLAVDRGLRLLLLATRVTDDARGRVLIAVGGVLDQLLLGQLEALGLAASRLFDGGALLAAALVEL